MEGERPFLLAHRDQPRSGGQGAGAGRKSRWGDIYATLIRHGHRECDLGRYTRRQLMLYYERALAVDRLDRAGRMQDMNLAVGGGKKAADHLQKLLR